MRRFLGLIIAVTGFLFAALPASAGFEVCNSTPVAHQLSVAYRGDADWVSEGWWTIQPQECKLLVAGDLSVRYFYYRATAKKRSFVGERYMFCTDSKAFTIAGKTDCQDRGFSRDSFSEVEIGSGVTAYKLTLVDNPPQQTQKATPSAPDSQSGSLGEPYSVSGVFQECGLEEDAYFYCAFHAEGWKWNVYKGGGTPVGVMNQLKALEAGDLADFSGDLISFADASVEAVVRSLSKHGPRNENENLIAGLQGKWRNTADRASVMIIRGGEGFEYYGRELMEVNYLQFADQCEGSHGVGPVLIKKAPGDPETYCYVVLGWDAVSLQLSYVGAAGSGDTFYEKFR